MSKSTSKEKQETVRLLTDAEKYRKETEEAIFKDDKEYTDYQFDVAKDWLQRNAGIKK